MRNIDFWILNIHEDHAKIPWKLSFVFIAYFYRFGISCSKWDWYSHW